MILRLKNTLYFAYRFKMCLSMFALTMEPDPRPGSEVGAKNLKSRYYCQIHGGLHISFLTDTSR